MNPLAYLLRLLAHMNPAEGNFLHIAYPYKLFGSKYIKNEDSCCES